MLGFFVVKIGCPRKKHYLDISNSEDGINAAITGVQANQMEGLKRTLDEQLEASERAHREARATGRRLSERIEASRITAGQRLGEAQVERGFTQGIGRKEEAP
ncbi:hypothetical protein BST61_g10061 [Cercospora zeina]